LLIFIFLTNIAVAYAQMKNNNDRPKLVVGIVVDQMRWDYLYKYYQHYNNEGLKRMLNEGFSAENTLIPYIPTYTAIGHTSIYAGSVPAIHGIAGNTFYIKETQSKMYCSQDDSVKSVGNDPENKGGKMSPKNMLSSSVTDELKLATDFRSRVFGVALKDRGAIFPAGHFADGAYWMVDGNWITSSFYMNDLPSYVKNFNKADFTSAYLSKGWQLAKPSTSYMSRINDDNRYEERFLDSVKVTFPIDLSTISSKKGRDVIKSTPFGNTITLQFAKELITQENLGNNPAGVPDFLAISLSSTDYIGHQFAINSLKIEDTYIRLDKDLGDFFNFLDTKIGRGNYTVFLTADHGAAHNPQYILDEKGNGGYFMKRELQQDLNNLLKPEFGTEDLIYNIANNQVLLNHKLIESKNLDTERIKEKLVTALKKREGVSFATDMERLQVASMPEWIKTMAINGYNYKRSGDILIIFDPQWIENYRDKTGTTHGAWNPYDSHIPLVFMGWGIKQGNTHAPVYMTDIAPTIAALLHIQAPNGCIGKPITELLDK
ncbi:MAG TPA: alkaline phosphatase family protein, partial [Saprospiraceae bacterium]|nr:alkaline phosphatase family protein [Saprospiraceae bacterium]